MVRKGQKVNATDVIAEAKLSPEHMLLDLARGLGVSESQAELFIQCKAGMPVAQGDVLAGPVGFTKRVVRAPQNGRVVLVAGSQALLEIEHPQYELKAGLPGLVTTLVGDSGVVIETTGALIQGVWGNQRVDFGLMNLMINEPDDVLTSDKLDVSLRGSVLLAGHCGEAEALKTAGSLPVRGLILASLDAALIPLANRLTYPILVLDGFGKIPMNNPAFKLLTTSERREVAVNASSWERLKGSRPELIIQLTAPTDPPVPQDVDVFVPGLQVRVIRAPHLGKIGQLSMVQPGLTALPNSIKAACAEVQFDDGEKVVIPLVNLEILR
jgi:hypothetical protein